MKIGFIGLPIEEGKVKYNNEQLNRLVEKDKPKKICPYFAEFIKEEIDKCDVIAVHEYQVLDLLIHDMDKADTRIQVAESAFERDTLEYAMGKMEEEIPLCDIEFNSQQEKVIANGQFFSTKPVIIVKEDDIDNPNKIIKDAIEKADLMFFYTSGPKESHAWMVNKNSDIVTCAGKIHTDLARGFIRGDIVAFEDYLAHHNFNDCKAKGVAKVVEKDYIVNPDEIVEIRFNV